MFKVLIIDDEPIIRKGLKNIIHWKQFNCEICGEASDGLEGRDLIIKLLPDIIITDIRMPEVDGLTMIAEIKSIVPESKIIILTGYRDFDYAREAIKLGAFELILKPTKFEELTAIIKRALNELKFQRDRAEEISKLRKQFEQNIPTLREKLLYDIIYQINTDENDIAAKMELYHIEIDSFILIIVENESEEEEDRKFDQYHKHLYQFGVMNIFEDVFSESFDVVSIPLDNRRAAFLIQTSSFQCSNLDAVYDRCVYLQQAIQSCFGFTVTIAVSSEGKGVSVLPSKFKECQDALAYKAYIGSNSIILYHDLRSFFKYEDHPVLEKYQKSLLESIKSGSEKTVKNILQSIFSYVDNLDSTDMEYLKNFYWNTISSIHNIRISLSAADHVKNTQSNDISSLYKLIKKSDNIRELNELLEEAATSVAVKINHFNNKNFRLILQKAVDYLQDHYQEQVTLNEVAEHVYVSTYYISRMFKKELGRNFVDYLNEIRIHKAKELLKNVKYKTYEVAEMVGIPDPHYFSKLFKKYEGLTPTEYRDTLK